MKKGKYQKRGTAAKAMLLVLALVLLIGGTIGGVVAWLMATSETITNTFTYGDINITLEETTTDYKMVPGNQIAKDPKVTVAAGSEDCYLFVKLVKSDNYDTYLADYEMAADWTALADNDGVYYREAKAGDAFYVLAAGEGADMANGHVDVLESVTKADMAAIKDAANQPTLKITAYAVQKANVADAATAWTIANS